MPNDQGTSRLTEVNHAAIVQVVQSLGLTPRSIRTILLLSPSRADHQLARRLFPSARVAVTFAEQWNLYEAAPTGYPHFDLAISSNVQMYSKNPSIWFDHILSVADLYIFQDLKFRLRSQGGADQFGDDGDSARYTLRPESTAQPSYALSSLACDVEQYLEFEGVPNAFHNAASPPIHIVAAVRSQKRNPEPAHGHHAFFWPLHGFRAAFASRHLRRLAGRLLRKPRR